MGFGHSGAMAGYHPEGLELHGRGAPHIGGKAATDDFGGYPLEVVDHPAGVTRHAPTDTLLYI